MKNETHLARLAAVAIATLGIGAAPADAALTEDPEVIIDWNQLLQSNIPSTAQLFSFRYYAMLHIAMFDAVNSIEGEYEPYHVEVKANPAASSTAAAAQAAHDILVALIPAQTTTFDNALASRLATIEPWRVALAVPVGKQVAQAVLDWRTGDGSEQPNLPFAPPALPGQWQPTAAGQVAGFVQLGNVEPFALLTVTQFLPDPPPLLNSAQYAADVEQVRLYGSSTSAVRSAYDTLSARLYAGIGYTPNPFGFWSNVARNLARSRHLDLDDAARLFALVTAANHDGLQTSHASKFVYNLWRPITAIQRADEDGNPATAPDTTWATLIPTPPYPSHSSNLQCVGTSGARAAARALGIDAPVSVTWTGTGGNANVTRSYPSLSAIAQEAGMSRVYGGIHFTFELTASHEACTKVADWVVTHHAQPRN